LDLNRLRYLGRETEGEASLQWLRGAGADIKAELIQIQNANILAKKYAAKLKNLFGRAYIKPLIVSIGLMFFQQFSGVSGIEAFRRKKNSNKAIIDWSISRSMR